MFKLPYRIFKRIIISRKKKSVRRGIIFLLTNMMTIACIIFAVEIVIVLLGTEDVHIPLTHSVQNLLKTLFF